MNEKLLTHLKTYTYSIIILGDIADNAKAIEVLTELQNLPHETHDVGYGMNNAQSYNYKTGIFTSDAGYFL